ncbi:hypothetical protein [Sinomonas mesophila]|uniref:hypothetical protein n=1 Tax=Sinomonas mesophila TaxID=1531955 RepID=UPI001FEC1814|nr:hypothetical protein [Sinomonas mesophila]
MDMRRVAPAGLAAAAMLTVAGCTGGGGPTASPTATATPDRVYSADELRGLISGLHDSEGNELRLYSEAQVAQGKGLGDILLDAATVDPADCKEIATAGLETSVDRGSVAVAISESQEPRTVSAQSGSEGPNAKQILSDIRGKMGGCSTFTVEVLGQRTTVSSEELDARTNADETFGTVSTRDNNTSDMLMQVSGAEGRLLVVATKSGAGLSDDDRTELEGLVNEVLDRATSPSPSPTTTTTRPTTTSPATRGTDTATDGTMSPATPGATGTILPTGATTTPTP